MRPERVLLAHLISVFGGRNANHGVLPRFAFIGSTLWAAVLTASRRGERAKVGVNIDRTLALRTEFCGSNIP